MSATIQKLAIAIVCGLLSVSVCRSTPEPSRSIITIRFGEDDPPAVSKAHPVPSSTETAAPAANDDASGDLSQTDVPPQQVAEPDAAAGLRDGPVAVSKQSGRWVTVRRPVYGRFGRFRGYENVRVFQP